MQTLLFPMLKITLFFYLNGFCLMTLLPQGFRHFHNWIDRTILAFFSGILLQTMFFYLANCLFGLKINFFNMITATCVLLAAASIKLIQRTPPKLSGKAPRRHKWPVKAVTVVLALSVIFAIALQIRLQNQLSYPKQLLDSDPYRHEIRSHAMLATGMISPFDPYIVGQTPVFELQGCYVLSTLVGHLGNFNGWQIWMWCAQIAGALCIFAIYLFAKYLFRLILIEQNNHELAAKHFYGLDLSHWVGLIAAALLGASPVHILRTNMGFSEALTLPYLPLTLLFYLMAHYHKTWADYVAFGLCFTLFAFINPVPAVFMLPLLIAHFTWTFIAKREMKQLYGFAAAAGIFILVLIIWNWKILAVPLFASEKILSDTGTQGILKDVNAAKSFSANLAAGWAEFRSQAGRNITWLQFFGGALGMGLSVYYGFKKLGKKLGSVHSFVMLSYLVPLLVLFLIPFGVYKSFTMYYYRHFIVFAFVTASLCGVLAVWLASFIKPKSLLISFYLILSLSSLYTLGYARAWGSWILNCSKEEYQIADWINKNAEPNAIIIANWYTGDYLRSLTKRYIINSDYSRNEVQSAKKKSNLDIVILPKQPEALLSYVNNHPGVQYYLVTSQWGPWSKYEANPHFEEKLVAGTVAKTQSKIFKINPLMPITGK